VTLQLHRDKRQAGFTLIEVTLVCALVSALTLMIVEALADLSRSQAYTRGQSRIAEAGDRIMRNVVQDLTYAIRVFSDDDDGGGYLRQMAYPKDQLMPGSRMPALTEIGFFARDADSEPQTGNLLFFARHDQPRKVQVQVDGADQAVRIDTFRFGVYYLHVDPEGHLDLARWASVPVALSSDLMVVKDSGERVRALLQLHEAGIRHVWDKAAPVGASLFELTETGTTRVLPRSVKVPGDPSQQQESIVGSLRARVASNGRVGGLWTPAYAAATVDGFPGGFEVKVDGPSTGKLVMARLMLRAGAGGSGDNFTEVKRIVSCRDG